ncbi:MAG TPA: glycine zipper 2TM domain-containing protein [Ramlibacter sp.]|nr:glycine zipper 2TM domain-containing protein [Ramlibacter sp.]
MKKSVLFCAAALAGLASAQAQEVGRVISSTPVIQQVAVPRQTCTQQPVVVEQPATSGAGSVIGAIAGGLLGNTIGHGGGRAAATAIGAMTGAVVGNRVESGPAYAQNLQQCTTQTFYENRTVAYNVTYEYNGQQHTVQMPHDPGPTVRLQVTPVGALNGPAAAAAAPVEQPAPVPQVIAPPVQTYVAPAPVVVQSYPVYPAYPVYYARPYHPPISLHFGYVHGGHRHHRHHWR